MMSVSRKRKHESNIKSDKFLPPVDRTMESLDKAFFCQEIQLVAVKLGNQKFISKFSKNYDNYILQQPGISHVVIIEPIDKNLNAEKGILLNEQFTDLTKTQKELSQTFKEISEFTSIEFIPYTLKLTYDYWKAEEILGAILPEALLNEMPCGFTVVGHVAHLNIKEQYLPYKEMIGQVVLDKNPRIRTVVNKLDAIDTVFRTFKMEILAGEPDYMVEHSESNCKFRFDFSKVYWNSRLHTEHDRLIRQFKTGEAVCDVFAGVGPFAIPAGKKNVVVFANDLNPDSYKFMVENIKQNKVDPFVQPFNQDARSFIKEAVDELLKFQKSYPILKRPIKGGNSSRSKAVPQAESISVPKYYSHYAMNLPDSATDFLESFIGLYSSPKIRAQAFGSENPNDVKLPLIHVHCFHKYESHEREPSEDVVFENLRKRVSTRLAFNMLLTSLRFHNVRRVAPTKVMYCISFKLPLEVAIAQ